MQRQLHRFLLRLLLPDDFVARFGRDMTDAFMDEQDESGLGGRIWRTIKEALDLLQTRRAMIREGRGRLSGKTTLGGGIMGIGAFKDDMKYASRALIRRPAFSAFVVFTVALGVGATTAVYSAVEGVLLRPIPYPAADRMVSLMRPIGNSGGLRTPAQEQLEAWSGMTDVFERIELFTVRSMTLIGAGDPREISAGLIRPSFHAFSGREPLLGRSFRAEELSEDARVVMIGHGLWRSQFASAANILGESLTLDGEAWTIIGVMPPRTPTLGFGARSVDIWRPQYEGIRGTLPIGVLREGVTIEVANQRLEVPVEVETGQATGTALSLVESVGLQLRDRLRALFVAAGALLLIAGLNVSNLLLNRANERQRETAIRSALGGGGVRIGRQVLVEGLLLGGLGGLVGIGAGWIGLEFLLEMRPASLEALDAVRLNGRVVAFALLLTLGTSLVFSAFPVWQAVTSRGLGTLRDGGRTAGSTSGSRLRWVLISTEIALSFVLVVGATLVLGALGRLQQTELGFAANRVVSFELNLPAWEVAPGDPAMAEFDALQRRLETLPGVTSVARALGRPGSAGLTFGRVQVEGGDPAEDTELLFGPPIGPGYFATMGQRLVGREFSESELSGEENAIILGETTARRYFGSPDAIGKRIRFGEEDDWLTVVGVADDVVMQGISSTSGELQIYYPFLSAYATSATFFLRMAVEADEDQMMRSLVGLLRSETPSARISELALMEDLLQETLSTERFTSRLLSVFTLMALILAAVGLYGVVSQVVAQRTREIGIRIALGADFPRIRRLVLRGSALATLMGLLSGAGLTMIGHRWATAYLFGLEGGGFGGYLAATAVLAGVALLASWAPAVRASRVDPTTAMRAD